MIDWAYITTIPMVMILICVLQKYIYHDKSNDTYVI